MADNIKVSDMNYLWFLFWLTISIGGVKGQDFWKWRCQNTTGLCSRISVSNQGSEPLFPTPEVCRLVCGRNGALWPQPTQQCSLGKNLIRFSPSSINFNIIANGEARNYLLDTKQYFLEIIGKENTANCVETNNLLQIEIRVHYDRMDLTWKTDESYQLRIIQETNQINVYILAITVYGARHGLETLLQLIETYPDDNSKDNCLVIVDSAEIKDQPAFEHRGLLIDTARNYQSISVIKRHLDAMAASKLNVLHWHITDSQSFPLQLKLDNMTKFGAYSNQKTYDQDSIKSIVHYARIRGIRILFEFDAPSHAGNGWQWGPEAGFGDLAVCVNQSPYRSYCIQPPCGQLNPINEHVYTVLKEIYREMMEMNPDSGFFHMGGDEVYFPCWNSTQEIVEYLKGNTSLPAFLNLWGHFQNRALTVFDEITNNANTPIILWTSHLTNTSVIEKYLTKDRYVIQTWVPANDSLPQDLLTLGYEIIVSTKDAWYLDHGFWGITQYHGWRKVYDNKIPRQALGGETCMWGEYVDDFSVEPRTWPRASAAAERLWSNPRTRYTTTEARFYRHRERLIRRGINAEALVPRWCYQNEGECS